MIIICFLIMLIYENHLIILLLNYYFINYQMLNFNYPIYFQLMKLIFFIYLTLFF